MFVFSENPTFWWPVKVVEPHPETPGTFVEREFEAQFVMLDPVQARASLKARSAIIARITADLTEAEADELQDQLDLHDRGMTLKVLKNWRGIEDATGKAIPFNDATFAEIYKHRRVRNGLVAAYLDAVSEDKARLGN